MYSLRSALRIVFMFVGKMDMRQLKFTYCARISNYQVMRDSQSPTQSETQSSLIIQLKIYLFIIILEN